MFPLTLSRERLQRILRILDSHAGDCPLRQFERLYSLWEWELEAAAALGWVEIQTIKPPTGRPSRVVRKVSKPQPRNLPPSRWQIERPISIRHWNFALHSTTGAIKGGLGAFGRRAGITGLGNYSQAYKASFPNAKSHRGAAASMSRLLRHPHVRAARQWFYAKSEGEIPLAAPMPETAAAIWQALRDAGSWRTRYAPAAVIVKLL